MGTLTAGPLSQLALALRGHFGIEHFVETGTFRGATTRWAAGQFKQVTTVELNAELYAEARTALSDLPHVRVVHGDSGTALTKVVEELTGTAMFWLDAHAGGGYFAAEDYCPLVPELEAINRSPASHVILIDDARAFLAPPPPPFDASRWPSLDEVILTLNARHRLYCVCILDAIIAVPASARDLVTQFTNAVRPKI